MLQIVANPEQISTKGVFWGALLREAEMPPLWWNWLRNHPVLSKCEAVRLHVQYAGETTQPYGVLKVGEDRDLFTLTELLSVACMQGISLFALAGNEPACAQFVRERLRWLAQSQDDWVRRDVAENEQTPKEVLQVLEQDDAYSVRMAVVRNEQTPVEVLRMLAQDEDWVVRMAAAENSRMPVELLQRLAR